MSESEPKTVVLDLASIDEELCREMGIPLDLVKAAVVKLEAVSLAPTPERIRKAAEALVASIPPVPPPRPMRPVRVPMAIPDMTGPSHRRFERQKPAKVYASTRGAGRKAVGREALREWRKERAS